MHIKYLIVYEIKLHASRVHFVPHGAHLVAQLGMIGLEFPGSFRKENHDRVHGTANGAHQDAGDDQSNNKSEEKGNEPVVAG